MATRAQQLDTAIDQIIARIIEVTASPNPDYLIAGRSISKSAYLATLDAQLITLEEARQRADGAFEIRSRGIT